ARARKPHRAWTRPLPRRRGGVGAGVRGRADQARRGAGEGGGRAARRGAGGPGRGLVPTGAAPAWPAPIAHPRGTSTRLGAALDTARRSLLRFPPTFGRVPRDLTQRAATIVRLADAHACVDVAPSGSACQTEEQRPAGAEASQ